MPWSFWGWIGCNAGISALIFFAVLVVLTLLQIKYPSVFFSIVTKLLNIQRCAIDVNNQVIRTNSAIDIDVTAVQEVTGVFLNFASCCHKFVNETEGEQGFNPVSVSKAICEFGEQNAEALGNQLPHVKDKVQNTLTKKNQKTSTGVNICRNDPNFERIILNVYGRYLGLHKRTNKAFIIIMTTTIIASAIIAIFNTLFLATTSVYQYGSCPVFGFMECFYGQNHTYFSCNIGQDVSLPSDIISATCFRWIARDIKTSDITTQIGVTTGLLIALGNIAQCFIRLYLAAFSKRLSIANGLHRMIAKTAGINKHTAPTTCCTFNCKCHCSALNWRLYKSPWFATVLTAIYLLMPWVVIATISLLYAYQLNVTGLTFVILITFAMLSVIILVWLIIEEDETHANIPGGWKETMAFIRRTATESMKMIKTEFSAENTP